ncbi:MAG: PD40 domain-containing protein [Deltaproteobacteria bacterium]|nr:PD40 domain-containing protein [Deltaproteobacteria bacterium]
MKYRLRHLFLMAAFLIGCTFDQSGSFHGRDGSPADGQALDGHVVGAVDARRDGKPDGVPPDASHDAGVDAPVAEADAQGPDSGMYFIELIDVSSTGVPGDGVSETPSVSADGQLVAFSSAAKNLIPSDTNGESDAFLRDRPGTKTSRLNEWTDGKQSPVTSGPPSLSSDGKYVAFVGSSSMAPSPPPDGDGPYLWLREIATGKLQPVNKQGSRPAASADGRHVAFMRWRGFLPDEPHNEHRDVYAWDRDTGNFSKASISSTGEHGNGECLDPISISSDGRFVAFASNATNLVPGDTNQRGDVFVHDLKDRKTVRVSVATGGKQADRVSQSPSISGDGRYVAFQSYASNLVENDTNGDADVFVHDTQTGETSLVSGPSEGVTGSPGRNGDPSISADGRFVAFWSTAQNLVAGQVSGAMIYVHDRETRKTARVSLNSKGEPANASCLEPRISADGRTVVFQSAATNLGATGQHIYLVRNPLAQ